MKALRELANTLPITIKIPVVVAMIMIAVAIVASERVLTRLVATQERQIRELTTAYLDGLASPLLEPVLRADPWEIFAILDQARQLDAAVRPVDTVVTDTAGAVLAGSNPRNTPLGSRLPAEFPTGVRSSVLVREDTSQAFVDRALVVEGRRIGTLHAEFDISALLAERREVVWTLLGTNTALTLGFAALGWLSVRRMVRPMKLLSEHLEGAQDGTVKPIPAEQLPGADSEAGRLFRRFNDMASAVSENKALAARLYDEERLASLGRLASGMAHEINNPLGGLFNAIDTLKKHGDKPVVRSAALSLIERGLFGIRDVVQAALATYRPNQPMPLLTSQDFDDVRLLLQPELRRRHQSLDWHLETIELPRLPGTPVRQAVLNLLLNASAAAGEGGRIGFSSLQGDRGELLIEVCDSGPGMPPDAAAILTGDRSYDMLRDKRGLGLSMVRRLVEELGGTVELVPSPLGGAGVRLRLGSADLMQARDRVA